MAEIIEIYNTEIDPQYIKEYPMDKQSIAINQSQAIASKMDIKLDNSDPTVFSDLYTTGLFYGSDWYNQPVTIYDDELEIYTWYGRIKNIIEDWKNGEVIVSSSNFIRDLADTICVYQAAGNVTPAEVIYNILTDTTLIGVTDAFINYGSVQNAINIQDADSIYVQCTFTKEMNKSCLDVIRELCRITQMEIFTVNNIIHLWQWEEYAGGLGHAIYNWNLVGNNYKHEYNIKNISNDYKVYYKNGAGVDTVSDSDATSIAIYGTQSFLVPDKDLGDTAADFPILILNSIGAGNAGDKAISRFKYAKKQFELTVGYELSFLRIGDQTDLHFGPLIREPGRIIGHNIDRHNKQIDIKGEYLNIPYQYFVRDIEAPLSPELVFVAGGSDSLTIKWTQNQETDLLGYYIYLAVSPGNWLTEECNLGRSRIEIKNPDVSWDGYAAITLYQLASGVKYFVKISAFDTSYNESNHSNILSAFVLEDNENKYCIQGDPFIEGLTLDINNDAGGTVISGTNTYGSGTYGSNYYEYSGIYESNYFYNKDGLTSIKFKGFGDNNDITYQYKEADTIAGLGNWSTETNAIGLNSISLSKKYVQIRFIFHSPNWSDTDKIYILEVL